MRKASLIFILALVFSIQSQAAQQSSGWKFMPSLMYMYNSTQNGTTTTSTNSLFGDASLGLMFQSSPLYLGATVNYISQTTSGGATNKDVYTSYGPSVGILTENVYMLLTYMAMSQLDNTTTLGMTSYLNGNGFQFALGYMFAIGQSTFLGPRFTYSSLSYNQVRNTAGVTSGTSYTVNALTPYLTLLFSL